MLLLTNNRPRLTDLEARRIEPIIRRMYRAAIVGTGRIASLLERDPLRPKPCTHAGWYRRHPGIELVAGADTDPARLADFGSDWGIPSSRLFAGYRDMLREVRPDVLSVCAFAPERLEMVRAGVEHGVGGFWIEKAIGCSIREALELQRTLDAAGASAIVDHPRRADGRYRAVRRAIDGRTLGSLQSVHVLMNGLLIHTGSHAWDLLDYWCGPWVSAQAWLDAPVPSSGPVRDRGGRCHVVFESGVQAFVSACEKDYYVFQFDLVFEGGRIQIGNDVCRLLRPAPSPRYSGFVELAEQESFLEAEPYDWPMAFDLVRSMETGDEPVMSVRNAVTAFRLGVAFFQSEREGRRPVGPSALDPDLRIESV
jgi:predicted dehydrogenase